MSKLRANSIQHNDSPVENIVLNDDGGIDVQGAIHQDGEDISRVVSLDNIVITSSSVSVLWEPDTYSFIKVIIAGTTTGAGVLRFRFRDSNGAISTTAYRSVWLSSLLNGNTNGSGSSNANLADVANLRHGTFQAHMDLYLRALNYSVSSISTSGPSSHERSSGDGFLSSGLYENITGCSIYPPPNETFSMQGVDAWGFKK